MRNEREIGRLGIWSAVLVVALVAVPAGAQPAAQATAQPAAQPAEPPAAPDQATRDQANAHYRAGKAAFDAGNFEQALTEFRAANDLIPGARALSYIGQCLRKLGRDIEALQNFRMYVQLYPTPANDRDRQSLTEVNNWIEEIQDTAGKVVVNVALTGATVLVDGQVVGIAPLGEPLELVQGPHTIRAEAEGYRPVEEAVTVVAAQEGTVTLVPSPLQTTAAVSLTSNVPEATATLDGQSIGTLPYVGEVQAGVHQLEVAAEGYETARLSITLEAGQPFSRSVELTAAAEGEEAWYEKWWVWTIAGVVVGGATAGIVLGATAGESMPGSRWTLDLP